MPDTLKNADYTYAQTDHARAKPSRDTDELNEAQLALMQANAELLNIDRQITGAEPGSEQLQKLLAAKANLSGAISQLSQALTSPSPGQDLRSLIAQTSSATSAAGSAISGSASASAVSPAQELKEATVALGQEIDKNRQYLSDDYTDKLKFSSEAEKEAFKKKNKETEAEIERLKKTGRPEDMEEAGKLQLARNEAIIARGGADVPGSHIGADTAALKRKLDEIQKERSSQIKGKNTGQSGQLASDFDQHFRDDIRRTAIERGMTEQQADAHIAKSANLFEDAKKIIGNDAASDALVGRTSVRNDINRPVVHSASAVISRPVKIANNPPKASSDSTAMLKGQSSNPAKTENSDSQASSTASSDVLIINAAEITQRLNALGLKSQNTIAAANSETIDHGLTIAKSQTPRVAGIQVS